MPAVAVAMGGSGLATAYLYWWKVGADDYLAMTYFINSEGIRGRKRYT
jgi:hypothetical protein